jgi:lipoic acid synthetase
MGELQRRPDWLRVKQGYSDEFLETLKIVRASNIRTVCEEALCPNIGECWRNKTATLLIMGGICTRKCGFCNVKTGCPLALDSEEPQRAAECVRSLNLGYAVITSVNRDDLPDGGAHHFARTISAIKMLCPRTKVEALIPDFLGDFSALQVVIDAKPDVLGHNLEIVRRFHQTVKRPPADYDTSLRVLSFIKKHSSIVTKTGLIVGVGETSAEIYSALDDIVQSRVDIVTIGQYLVPSTSHYPISRFVTPEEFEQFKEVGEQKGVKCVVAGPLVRSSYNAQSAFGNVCCTMASDVP